MMKRVKRILKTLALCGVFIIGSALIIDGHTPSLVPPDDKNAITGRAYVSDGDTIHIGEQKIRLEGIDAPEIKQYCDRDGQQWSCGVTARDALRKQIGNNGVRCTITGQDRYKRHLGHCWLGDQNLNSWMVRNGHALAYSRYSKRYVPEELAAWFENAGLHASRYEKPADYRKRMR